MLSQEGNASLGLIGDSATDLFVLNAAGIFIESGSLVDKDGLSLDQKSVAEKLKSQAKIYREVVDKFVLDDVSASQIQRQMTGSLGGGPDQDVDISAYIGELGRSAPSAKTWDTAIAQFKEGKPVVKQFMATLDLLQQIGAGHDEEYRSYLRRIDATGAVLAIGSIQQSQRDWLKEGRGDWMEMSFRAPKAGAFAELVFGNAVAKPADISDKSSPTVRSTVLAADEGTGSRAKRIKIMADGGAVKAESAYISTISATGVTLSVDPAQSPIFRRTSDGKVIVSDFDGVTMRFSPNVSVSRIFDTAPDALPGVFEPVVRTYSKPESGEVWIIKAEQEFLEKHFERTRSSGLPAVVKHGFEAAFPNRVLGGGPESVNLSVDSRGRAMFHQPESAGTTGSFPAYMGRSLKPGEQLFAAQEALNPLVSKTGHPRASGYDPTPDDESQLYPGALISLSPSGGLIRMTPKKVFGAGTFDTIGDSFSTSIDWESQRLPASPLGRMRRSAVPNALGEEFLRSPRSLSPPQKTRR